MAFQPSYAAGRTEFKRLRPDKAFQAFDIEPTLKVAPFRLR